MLLQKFVIQNENTFGEKIIPFIDPFKTRIKTYLIYMYAHNT